MQVKVMQLGMIGTNCYIFWDEDSRKCAVVDPGDDGAQVAAFIQGQGLEPVAILLTHSHFDHVGGVKTIAADTGCRVFLCPEELTMPPQLTVMALDASALPAATSPHSLSSLVKGLSETSPSGSSLNAMAILHVLKTGQYGRTPYYPA